MTDWMLIQNIDKTWEIFMDCGKYFRLWNKEGELHLVLFCIDLMPHYLFWIIKSSQNTLLKALLPFSPFH